ncbi:MAG: uncharacterized protein H6Q90_1400 [Deltaproteobacteria bacterium]|nr:uncharacterized protein [Deltaproteobacteria bacterium]
MLSGPGLDTHWTVRFLAGFLILGGCATGGRVEGASDAAAKPDAPGTVDALVVPGVDGPVSIDAPAPAAGSSLLLTEVVLAPSTGEFVEIANPTGQTVDLSTYYLSDSGTYFRLPAGSPTVDSTDFIAQFPAGATIAPGAVITVALDTTANFQTAYATAPTFSIASGTMTSIAVNGTPNLTNAGEIVVVFQWDGQADLVRDVDLVVAGVPTVANGLVDKSAMAFDGPDTGSATTAYGTDTRTIAAQSTAPASGKSTKRILRETGHELQTGGGNGIAGDDETAEDTGATWDTVYTAPTPGVVPAGLLP